MPLSDRDSLIALLDRLGSPEDPVALAAAREIDTRIKNEGLNWDALLVKDSAANDDEDDAPGHVHDAADDAADDAAATVLGDTTNDLAIVERLLAHKELSADTREILQDLKEDLTSGGFTEADRRYIRSLEARLSAGRKK